MLVEVRVGFGEAKGSVPSPAGDDPWWYAVPLPPVYAVIGFYRTGF